MLKKKNPSPPKPGDIPSLAEESQTVASFELSIRSQKRADKSLGANISQFIFATALLVTIAVAVAHTLRIAPTIQATACDLLEIADIHQVGDMSQGECVRGRTQWNAIATVYVTAWQQTRNATVTEQCEPDFDANWRVNSAYTCEYTSASVMRLQPDSLLATGETPSKTRPTWAYVCIGWMAAVMAPWLVHAGYRSFVLGCSNRSEDQKKLAKGVPFIMVWLPILALLGSIAFATMAWLEWHWHFQWAG